MKNMIKSLIAISVLVATVESKALLLEPILSMDTGTSDIQAVVGTNPAIPDKHTGMLYGARVGTSLMGIMFGALDYRAGTIRADLNGDITRTQMGLVFGVDLPLIRAWGGYNFQDDLKGTFYTVDRTIKGSSIKAGVGFGFIPFIELGVEYVMMTKGGEKDNSVLINVSAPFDL